MHSPLLTILLPGVVLAACFVWYTRRKKALTAGGALAAAFTGLWVLWFAGPLWLLPLFFFFISGVLLGRLTKGKSVAADAKHGKPRDYRQVLCNGGIYAALAVFSTGPGRETAQTLMALSLSVSASDTWSSEIGQYFRHKTVDILRWKPVPVGLSGGVSLAGTLGGLAGALAMAFLGGLLQAGKPAGSMIWIATCGGFAGMLLDSILGAALQARYRDVSTGALSDQGGGNRLLYSGIPWVGNDGVNFWSNALITLAGYCWIQ